MTHYNLTFSKTENNFDTIYDIIFAIAEKYDFMRYFECVEIDCFCINTFNNNIEKIFDFMHELNHATNLNFVLYYENYELDACDMFVTISTSEIFYNFAKFANEA